MRRRYVPISVAAVCGLFVLAGCYTEATIDNVNEVAVADETGSKRTRTPSARRPKPTTKPAEERDAEVGKVARETEEYAERLKRGRSATSGPASTTERVGRDAGVRSASPRSSKEARPGVSKRAVHTASDAFEARKVTPEPPAKPPSSAPWRQKPVKSPAAPDKVLGLPTTSPAKATLPPKAPPSKPSVPKVEKSRIETPSVPAAKPASTPPTISKAQLGTPKATESRTSAPRKPSVAAVSPSKPLTTPAPTGKAASPTKATGGFKVPKPPEIPSIDARRDSSKSARPATVPPAKPRVSVRAPTKPEPSAEKKKVAVESNVPAGTVRSAGTDGIKAVIDRRRKEVVEHPNDLEKQLALRLLYLADNQPKQALAEIPGTNAEVQKVIDRLVKVNLTAFQARNEKGDPATAAKKLLPHVEALRKLLKTHADLAIGSMKLCTRVDNFGVYDEVKPLRWPSNKPPYPLIVYCEIENYTTMPREDGQFRVLLAMKVQIMNTEGGMVREIAADDIPYVSRRRLEDFFLRCFVDLPEGLSPGKYILRVHVEDKLAGKVSEDQIEFTLTKPVKKSG